MASPKAPPQHKVLPLTDPHNIQEVFAHELSGMQVRDDGTCHFTFAVVRPKHSVPGTSASPDDNERVVTLRLVMPSVGTGAMFETLKQVQQAMMLHQATANAASGVN